MDLFGLPAHDPVSRRVREAAAKNALSHAMLFSGSGARLAAARFTAAAMECTAPSHRPCGVCEGCRKTAGDIHPDVITVRDPEHKNIAVDVIRDIRSDAYIRPNEGSRKVYIFPDCSLLPEQGQNVLLKIVEEGPPYAAFLFCAENSSQVLQTLRSRCVELKMHPAAQAEPELNEAALELCRGVARKRRGAVTEAAGRLERKKLSREDLSATLEACHQWFAQALLAQYGQDATGNSREIAVNLAKTLTKSQIMRTIELLQKYCGECAFNVGAGHGLGALAVELEDIL